MKKFDVIVIGGGPAGLISARDIAASGYNVLLVDMKKEIGRPVQCAEAITKYAFENNDIQIDERWVKQRVKGIKILLPGDRCFYSKVESLSIDRYLFEQNLAKKAIDNNATIKLKTQMKKISKNKDSWEVNTNNGIYQSKTIIGADGFLSQTARKLDLLTYQEYINAYQYTFRSDDISFDEKNYLCMTMDELFHGGYGWIFPRSDEYNVGVGSRDATINDLKCYCKRLNFDIKKNKKFTAGKVPYYFIFKKRSLPGVIIVGDAAGMTNPVTGGGIHAALYSGRLASKLIVESYDKNNMNHMISYDKIIDKSMFLHPIHRRVANYFNSWTNKDWEFFADTCDGLDMASLTLFKSFLIGLKNPRYMLRAKELLSIRKEMRINQKYGF